MAFDDILLRGLVTLFSGFIVSLTTVMNKAMELVGLIDRFFVVFFFLGIIITLLGALFLVVWNVKNQQPFEEDIKRFPFVTKLILGIFVMLTGTVLIFYVNVTGVVLFLLGLPCCFIGLYYLVKGLIEYVKDYYIPTQRTLQHS